MKIPKDYKFTHVLATKRDHSILFEWSGNYGWGEITVTVDESNGKLHVDTETMSLDFFWAMLKYWRN